MAGEKSSENVTGESWLDGHSAGVTHDGNHGHANGCESTRIPPPLALWTFSRPITRHLISIIKQQSQPPGANGQREITAFSSSRRIWRVATKSYRRSSSFPLAIHAATVTRQRPDYASTTIQIHHKRTSFRHPAPASRLVLVSSKERQTMLNLNLRAIRFA